MNLFFKRFFVSFFLCQFLLILIVIIPTILFVQDFQDDLISQSLIKQEIKSIWLIALITLLICILISLIISYFLSRKMSKPLVKLENIIEKVSEGNFNIKRDLTYNHELGRFSDKVNKMVTRLSKQFDELTDNKNRLTTIINHMIEGVLVAGASEKIILINPPLREMLNLRSEDIIDSYYWEVIGNEEVTSLIDESIKNNENLRREITIYVPKEKIFDVQTSLIILNDELIGIVCVFHDITALKSIDKQRSEFIADVSHELKTPITAIGGYVEALKDGAIDNKEHATKFFDIIITHTKRINNLVNDLLRLSRLEYGGSKLTKYPVILQDLIYEIVDMFSELITEKNIELKLEIPDTEIEFYVDEDKIIQVFNNLLENAIKYTLPNGKITMSVSTEENFCYIEFIDSGIGIPEESLDFIFERFYRVNKDRSRSSGGTGLGLAIVKRIVELHNGTVSVESSLNNGSKFIVKLPLKDNQVLNL